jgi:hypothetical protein
MFGREILSQSPLAEDPQLRGVFYEPPFWFGPNKS